MKKRILTLSLLLTAALSYRCQTDEPLNGDSAKLTVNVNLTVGTNTYENTDATVTASGYNQAGEKKWSDVFDVSNLNDQVSVKLGYHHYSFEMEKWGIHSEKSLTADEIWSRRKDGPAPVKVTLSGETVAKKIAYYTEFFEFPELGFRPQQKVKFEYNDDGTLARKIFYGFDPVVQSLVELRYLTFAYANNQVSTITGYFSGVSSPHVEHTYEYLPDGNVSLIHEKNYAASVNSTVSFLYNFIANKGRATYTYSNGQSFYYEFYLDNKNIKGDRTVKSADLCSVGEYTYDGGLNPFNQLGYLDYELVNYSINNRISENVNYLGCAFPTLVPESYSYVYDAQGYPIVATTVYKSETQKRRSQRIYIYN